MTGTSTQAGPRATTAVRKPSFAVLVLLSGVSPLATDMYLPALPALGRALHCSASVAQLTLTVFLIGLAAGQIVLGPMSDAFGRRVFLLAGPAAFALSSLVCAVAPNATVLLAARLVEGFAAAGGMVCATAVVSDYYGGDEADRRFGSVMAVSLLAPIIAPPLGSLVLQFGDWRTIFWLLTGVGLVQVAGVWWGVSETLPTDQRHAGSLAATVQRSVELLRDWRFAGHVTVNVLAVMGFFAYIGGSSFVLEKEYGLSSVMYGVVFAVDALLMATASGLFAPALRRTSVRRLRLAGLGTSAAAAAGLAVAALGSTDHRPPLALTWLCLALVAGGMGWTLPASTALSQRAGLRAKGTASALAGGLGFGFGSLTTPLSGAVGTGVLPMSLLMAGFLLAAVLVSRWTGRPAVA